MSTVEFNAIDSFLGHSGSSGRGGRYLKDWTKNAKPASDGTQCNGSIRVWLHTRRLPLGSWRHQIPQLVTFDDRDTGEQVKAYWNRPLVCWEDEALLKVQYRRDENGQLEESEPARKCSIDRLIDVVYQRVAQGKLDWAAPVFRFEGATDPKNDAIVHAGGLTGMFGGDKHTPQQIAYLKSRGIRQSEAWRENFHAKLAYVFAIVDNDNVGDGVQIAPQTSLVGDQVKSVIRDAQASLGAEDGNPMLKPFCIELTYNKNAASFSARYHARRIEKIRMTPEVESLIRSDPPSLAGAVRSFNQLTLRAFLERHAVIDLPWSQIFDVPQLVAEGDDEVSSPAGEQQSSSPPATQSRDKAPPAPASSARGVMIPCDKCKAPMREDEDRCSQCDTEYLFDNESPPPPGKITGDRPPFGRF